MPSVWIFIDLKQEAFSAQSSLLEQTQLDCQSLLSFKDNLQSIFLERAMEIRCNHCFNLFSPGEFQNHGNCQPKLTLEQLKVLRNKNKQFQQSHSNESLKDKYIYVDKIDCSGESAKLAFTFHLQVQLPSGETKDYQVERSMAQLVGYSKIVSKKEGESQVGKSAIQLYELLVQAQTLRSKQNWNQYKIHIQSFLNEALRDRKSVAIDESKSFFDFSKVNNLTGSDKIQVKEQSKNYSPPARTSNIQRSAHVAESSHEPIKNVTMQEKYHKGERNPSQSHLNEQVLSNKIDYRELQRQLGIQ